MALSFYRTALEEAQGQYVQRPEEGFRMPSYMRAANVHSIANKNTTWDEAIIDGVENTAKFVAASVVSGANQLYNAPIDIGNLFGADWERSDTSDVMEMVDSDLATYYKEHKEGIDTLGFIASSFVPGLAGVKALHAGQASLRAFNAGKIGNNFSKATGLLIPSKQKYLTKAINDVISGSSTNVLTNRNTLQALAAGFGQSTLEAASFEIAVAGTLFKSPVLENQDLGDLASNIAFGGLVGGAIGGAIDAARTAYAVKGAVKAADIEAKPWTAIAEAHSKSQTYEKIALDFDQLHTMPEIPKNLPPERITFLERKAAEKVERLNIRVRKNMGELAKGDQEVASHLYESIKQTSYENKLGTFIGLKQTARFADRLDVEKELGRLEKTMEKGGDAALEATERYSNLSVAHARIWGNEAGRVSLDAPASVHLVDTLKKGQYIKTTNTSVKAGDRVFEFRRDKAWDILKANKYEAEARHIWAQKSAPLKAKAGKPIIVNELDIPLLEKAYREFPENLQIRTEEGSIRVFTSQSDLLNFTVAAKEKVANRLLNRPLPKGIKSKKALQEAQLNHEDIANMVNVRASYLDGQKLQNIEDDIFALQSYSEEYTKKLISQGSLKASAEPIEIWNVPQNIKLSYDATPFAQLNNHVLENVAIIKQQQKLYIEGSDRAVASVLGEDYGKLIDITAKDIQQSNSIGAGGGFATAASANYGTLAAKVEYLGNTTTGMIEKFKNSAREVLEPLLYKVGQNQKAAIEWSTLNAKLRAIPEHYGLNEAGTALEPLAVINWRKAAAKAAAEGLDAPKQPTLKVADAPLEIPIENADTLALIKAHIELNGKRVNSHRTIRTAQGVQDTRKTEVFYPLPVNPKEYPYFALVSDESITGTGHTKTLYAATEKELDEMISKLKGDPKLRIRTKAEAKEYWESIGQWDYEKSLNDNYLDITMHRKGVSAPYLVATDTKKIVNDTLNWHMQRETGLVREVVAAKYEVPFNELRRLGDIYTNIATSRFAKASLTKYAEESIKNPYVDYIKVALGIPKHSDYPWWVNTNRFVEDSVSRMYTKINAVFESSKSPNDLAEINSILKQYGYKGAAYDESMELLANHTAPKSVLSKFVQSANSMLATVVLRWDALNAVNNAVSANVLLGAETKAILRAIEAGGDEAVGELAKLAKIKIPGSERELLSPTKLIANAVKKFGTNTPEMAFYKEHRFVTNISDQYRWTLDKLTLKGGESVRELEGKIAEVHSRLTRAATTGEKWTGNRLAEEFNRFVAADVMKQITDIGIRHKLLTAKDQLAYINTFVNRTQGNYLAAQRPMMFQGPIGQSIGLFQTYQFNLMQQLLRHVGEGRGKDAMTLLGLQGTIHGMNGLPAFNAINTHLIGNASGNTEHRDIYDATYGAAGKEAGDWLMYGVASNMFGLLHPDLKVNLYTRGDINPRHLTIVPTSPAEVPIVQASAKFIGNIIETAGKFAAGGDVATTLLQGLEHNGISRPLAGLAQTLEGAVTPGGQSYSTSKRGNVIASNDLFALANLTRIVGGKPFDEALALDTAYRFKSYAAKDQKRRNALGETLKTKIIAGQQITPEEVEEFAKKYAEAGGKQDQFTKWFSRLYTSANTSQVNQLYGGANSPFTQSMQRIMGGLELKDFSQ